MAAGGADPGSCVFILASSSSTSWPAVSGALVDPATRGDPVSPLRWTCLSTRNLADALTRAGHPVSDRTVARLLREQGYSLQGNAKVAEGAQHADRDAQFRFIAGRAGEFLAAGEPVISVDAKKKEKVGQFANGGAEWRPRGQPEQVNVHDFPSDAIGKAIPYGIYDLGANARWVSVGTDHDTSAFAAETLRRWWGIQLGLQVVASAGHGGVLQRAGGQQLIQRAGPGLHLLGLVLRALDRHADVAHLLGDPGDGLADAGLGLGGGIGGLDGLLAGTERLHLRLQALCGEGELVLLGLQRGLLPLQVADLRGDGRPPGQRLAGQVLAPRGECLLRLALQPGRRLLELGELQLDAPAAGRHVRHPAAHLLQQLQLPLVGVIKHLAGVLGAVQRLVRLGPEQHCDAAAETHPDPHPFQRTETAARSYAWGRRRGERLSAAGL